MAGSTSQEQGRAEKRGALSICNVFPVHVLSSTYVIHKMRKSPRHGMSQSRVQCDKFILLPPAHVTPNSPADPKHPNGTLT